MMTVLIFNVQKICKSRVNVQRGFSAFAEDDAIKITGSVQIKLLLRTPNFLSNACCINFIGNERLSSHLKPSS